MLRTPGAKAADGCGAGTAGKRMTATGEHSVWSRRMKGGSARGKCTGVKAAERNQENANTTVPSRCPESRR